MELYSNVILESIRQRFQRLYPDRAEECMQRLFITLGRYDVHASAHITRERWDERDMMLITYGDMVQKEEEPPLRTLGRFLEKHMQKTIRYVHILPFCPYSSDDGFSITDYRAVNPKLGTWEDVVQIGKQFALMFDLVLNHVSRRSQWFRDYVKGILPACAYFIEVDPSGDFSQVVRPRSLPLFTSTETRDGIRHLWTTFSDDQMDLNFANPDVLFEFLDILLWYVAMGARAIRLDAIAYLWKETGTSCIHLPQTHEIVRLLRDFLNLAAKDTLIVTETNVPHEENISYFGEGDEADMVYQFSLPPLLLHALLFESTRYLRQWAMRIDNLPAGFCFLNFTASHDGIGVRPLEGIIPGEEMQILLKEMKKRGGQISTRSMHGGESPYEVNITYYDALAEHDAGDPAMQARRFLLSQTVALTLRGIPAIYLPSLFATGNDEEGMKATGRARTINRPKFSERELDNIIHFGKSVRNLVFHEYRSRLLVRKSHAAFHPNGPQKVYDMGDKLFVVERTAPEENSAVLTISNFSSDTQSVDLTRYFAKLAASGKVSDILADRTIILKNGCMDLQPFEAVWLVH